MKINASTVSSILAAVLSAAASLLVIERGGIFAWAGLVVGLLLLVKTVVQPGTLDTAAIVISAALWACSWLGTKHHVISTWESGEVVELSIPTPHGLHTARTWVLDTDTAMVVYYDAEPEIVAALQAGDRVGVKRAGVSRQLIPSMVAAEAMPVDELARIFELMGEKYGDRNAATDVYYQWLGRSRDRIAVVVSFERPSP